LNLNPSKRKLKMENANNPTNEQWMEVTKAVDGFKDLFENFKSANDEEIKAASDKAVEVDTIVKTLETRFTEIEKKLTRQSGFHAANDDMQEGLEDFNKCRQGVGRKQFSENEAADYMEVCEKFLHKGGEIHLMEAGELKTLEEGRDPLGGYWVLPQVSARMIEKEFETSPMMDVATVETTQTDRFAYFVDFDEFDAFYTKELKSRDTTDTAKIGKKYIDIHTTFAKIPVSTEMLEDSTVNVTSWLTRKINNKLTRIRNNNYINGSGAGEEFGILSPVAPSSGAGVFGEVERILTKNSVGSGLDLDDFLNIFAELKGAYHTNASILMSRQMLFREVIKLKDLNGRYLIDVFDRPITSNVAAGQIPMALLGFRVVFMQDMAKDTSVVNQDVIAAGDFRMAYSIVTRRGTTVLRDPFSLDGGVFFKVDSRGGADVTNSEAYKILRIKA